MSRLYTGRPSAGTDALRQHRVRLSQLYVRKMCGRRPRAPLGDDAFGLAGNGKVHDRGVDVQQFALGGRRNDLFVVRAAW